MSASPGEITLPCPDLGKALAFFTGELGLRLDAIFPADDPRQAELSGHGVRIRLRREPAPARGRDGEWIEGRAGMRYRDLVPDRDGGRLIASQIQIADAGPVPDYVHFHDVRYQLIYCHRGWVRVVYEDQGPPFVLEAGDCVLQPPTIRHRVLESSGGLEVIEIGSPAEHMTHVDHELSLPTGAIDPTRDFAGQRFVRHVAREAAWAPWRWPGSEQRDLGIGMATQGLVRACVARCRGGDAASPGCHVDERALWVVLAGEIALRDAEPHELRLSAVEARVLSPAQGWVVLRASDDLELLEVVLPSEPG